MGAATKATLQAGDGGFGGGAGGEAQQVAHVRGVVDVPVVNLAGHSNNSAKESAVRGCWFSWVGGAGTYNNVGGDGRESDYWRVANFRYGGGGYQSPGGSGIGGAGMFLNGEGEMWASPPAPNTGSGGGGGASQEVEAGSAGIVIVRVEVA